MVHFLIHVFQTRCVYLHGECAGMGQACTEMGQVG